MEFRSYYVERDGKSYIQKTLKHTNLYIIKKNITIIIKCSSIYLINLPEIFYHYYLWSMQGTHMEEEGIENMDTATIQSLAR